MSGNSHQRRVRRRAFERRFGRPEDWRFLRRGKSGMQLGLLVAAQRAGVLPRKWWYVDRERQ